MRIDTGNIPGYAEMSAEDKIKALEGFEMEVPQYDETAEVKKLKAMISGKNGEIADYKRKWQSTLDDQQKAELERTERENAIQEELNTLRKEKTMSGYVSNFLENGYTPELARASAQAIVDGDMGTFFGHLTTFVGERDKAAKAESLKAQPALTPGAPPTKDILEQNELAQMRQWAGLT